MRHVFRDFYRIRYFQISVLNSNADAGKGWGHRLNSKDSKTPQNERHQNPGHPEADQLCFKTDFRVPRAGIEARSRQRAEWAPNLGFGRRKQAKSPRAYSIHEREVLQGDVHLETNAYPRGWHFLFVWRPERWPRSSWVHFSWRRVVHGCTTIVFQRSCR